MYIQKKQKIKTKKKIKKKIKEEIKEKHVLYTTKHCKQIYI